MDEDILLVKRPSWNKDQLELLCGIANAGGGRLVITSSDKRKGVRRIHKSFEAIPALTQRELGITCTTEPVMDDMQLCLEIVVPAAKEPVSYQGNYFLYTDGENKQIDSKELNRLLSESESVQWEKRPQPFIRQEDLDPDIVKALASDLGEDAAYGHMDAHAIRKALELYGVESPSDNTFTSLGVLLLHKAPQNLIPGAYVHVGFFTAQGAQLTAPRTITGPLILQLYRTLDLLYGNQPQDEELHAILNDAQVKLPPRDAVREALLNALVHKNYEDETPIRISVYPDVFYISNVGRPPAGWTENDLKGRHNSRPNNPSLVAALQKRNLFNGWGTGIAAMDAACVAAGLPEPSFDLRSDEIEVAFTTTQSEASDDHALEASSSMEKSEPTVPASAPTRSEQRPTHETIAAARATMQKPKTNRPTFKDHSIAAALDLDMTSTDEYILKVLETNGRVTAVRIAEVLGVSESTVRRSFRKLKELGFIERVGSDKAGYWRVH